jgi:hypothetical protein
MGDDKMLSSTKSFEGEEIVILEKMDGENSSLYREGYHARSLDSHGHPWQSWLQNFHAGLRLDIPEGFRICGENLYAEHSIRYDNLESFFMGFSMWNDKNECLSFDDTLEWFKLLNIVHVPVLWRGMWDEKFVKNFYKTMDLEKQEGFVVRVTRSFDFDEFSSVVGKWVRIGHCTSDRHWSKNWKPNKMRDS